MQFYPEIIAISLILTFLLILILLRREPLSNLFGNAIHAPWSLSYFTNGKHEDKVGKNLYIFTEQPVYSQRYRITGRFDQAILHWETRPILDAIIERKFPVHVIPKEIRSEDIFQAGLYALALMDNGISTDSTKLVVIYCLQKNAMKCVLKKKSVNCLECKSSRVFSKQFSPTTIMKKLRKLDEIWFANRKPKASPSTTKCRVCPYRNSKCKYSKA